MARRLPIAIALLLALAGAPLGGTLCALLCGASTQGLAHDGTDQPCQQPSGLAAEPRVTGAGHDCSTHDASMPLVATTAARADLHAKAAPGIFATLELGQVEVPRDHGNPVHYATHPDTDPPAAKPVVLRL